VFCNGCLILLTTLPVCPPHLGSLCCFHAADGCTRTVDVIRKPLFHVLNSIAQHSLLSIGHSNQKGFSEGQVVDLLRHVPMLPASLRPPSLPFLTRSEASTAQQGMSTQHFDCFHIATAFTLTAAPSSTRPPPPFPLPPPPPPRGPALLPPSYRPPTSSPYSPVGPLPLPSSPPSPLRPSPPPGGLPLSPPPPPLSPFLPLLLPSLHMMSRSQERHAYSAFRHGFQPGQLLGRTCADSVQFISCPSPSLRVFCCHGPSCCSCCTTSGP